MAQNLTFRDLKVEDTTPPKFGIDTNLKIPILWKKGDPPPLIGINTNMENPKFLKKGDPPP